jgi:isopropylmalate/homocitrate/citramalate synthase
MCVIYDTTLRDGEQMPGVVFSSEEKKYLAHEISDLGADLIGLMPAISESEKKLARELVEEGLGKKLISATMMRKEHIDLAKDLGFLNIVLFTSLSDMHLENKLKISRGENLKKSLDYISYAKNLGMNVYFAGEDASRADKNYLNEFVSSIGEGIESFLYCDTLGVLKCTDAHKEISDLVSLGACGIGLHMHNDFGQAVSNSLIGLDAGATLVSGTFNGIGERAGNASLEEILLSLREQFGKELNINYGLIGKLSNDVEKFSSVNVQANKPIVGSNVYSHESGIHVDGILKDSKNYEPFSPSIIGRERNIYFGKHSGISSLKYLFGDSFSKEEFSLILSYVKDLSQKEKKSFNCEETRNICSRFG